MVECWVDLTSRVGIPSELLTDNEPNFTSKVVRQCCQTTGIRQIRTFPYHPQTDGLVERYNSTLKHLLRKHTQNTSTTIHPVGIPWGQHTRPQGIPPIYLLLYGKEMKIPIDQFVKYWKGKAVQCEVMLKSIFKPSGQMLK